MTQTLPEAPAYQQWYSLEEACHLKGVNYKTVLNRKWLQPKGGLEDAKVALKKKWHRDTILHWLELTDSALEQS